MSQIQIEKCNEDKKKKLHIPPQPKNTSQWSIWECAPSTFDWHYDQKEVAYVYEGRVKVKTAEGETEINPGDLVTFPAGLSCTWQVLDKIRKVYRFE